MQDPKPPVDYKALAARGLAKTRLAALFTMLFLGGAAGRSYAIPAWIWFTCAIVAALLMSALFLKAVEALEKAP
jgi:hypothetical protein